MHLFLPTNLIISRHLIFDMWPPCGGRAPRLGTKDQVDKRWRGTFTSIWPYTGNNCWVLTPCETCSPRDSNVFMLILYWSITLVMLYLVLCWCCLKNGSHRLIHCLFDATVRLTFAVLSQVSIRWIVVTVGPNTNVPLRMKWSYVLCGTTDDYLFLFLFVQYFVLLFLTLQSCLAVLHAGADPVVGPWGGNWNLIGPWRALVLSIAFTVYASHLITTNFKRMWGFAQSYRAYSKQRKIYTLLYQEVWMMNIIGLLWPLKAPDWNNPGSATDFMLTCKHTRREWSSIHLANMVEGMLAWRS